MLKSDVMKKIVKYIGLALTLTTLAGLSSCSKHDDGEPERELPPYMAQEVQLTVGSEVFVLSLFDNQTGRAFRNLLPLTLSMDDVNGNEKYARLPQHLPTSAVVPATIRTGDLMLYGSDGVVLFYKTFATSYSYSRIGTLRNPAGLEAALGRGTVEITFAESPRPQTATLTYNIHGADIGTPPASVRTDQGSRITLDDGTGFSRTGYRFAGWNTRANGTGTHYPGGSSYTLSSDITLYAVWVAVPAGTSAYIRVGSSTFAVTLESNPTADAFRALLPMTIRMTELNGNEKYYQLPRSLPTDSSNPGILQNGDLMLYGSSTLVLFYKTFTTSFNYTRIGRIDNTAGLEAALGADDVTVAFETE